MKSFLEETKVKGPVPNPFTKSIVSISPVSSLVTREKALAILHKSKYRPKKAKQTLNGRQWVESPVTGITTSWSEVEVIKFEVGMKLTPKKFRTYLSRVSKEVKKAVTDLV